MIEEYVNAEELKRLLSSLLVVAGGLLIAALFAFILVPGLRNANKPEAPMPVNPVVGEPGWLDPAEFPPARGREIPPVDPRSLIAAAPELLARGKDIFIPNCAQCHGETGRGDGPAATTMTRRPRNFASPDGWTNGSDLPGIFKTLSQGVAGTSMAAFDYLSKKDRMALSHYVQSLGAFPHGAGSPGAMEALSKQLASAGEKTPNKIPVSLAMKKLEQEFAAAPPLLVSPDNRGAGAELARRVITDPQRAALTLAGSAVWRSGPRELATAILEHAPGNGFSLSAASLRPGDWQALFEELLKMSPRK